MSSTFSFDPPTSERIDIAAAAIDLAREQVDNLSGSAATAELQRLKLLSAKIDSYKTELVGKVKRSEVWRETDANGTAASFLRRELNVDQREVQSDLRAAAAFDEFPELAAAMQCGDIGRAAVDMILSFALRNQQRREALPLFVESFIKYATAAPLSLLRRLLVSWADQVDPTSTSIDESEARSRCYMHMSEFAGGVKIDAYFDKVSGMKIIAAMNAAFTAFYKETHRGGELISTNSQPLITGGDQSTAATQNSVPTNPPTSSSHNSGTDDTSPLDLAALNSKQRADAFIKMIIEPACEGKVLPTSGGFTPNVVVTVPIDRLVSPDLPAAAIQEAVASGNLHQLELRSAFIETTNGPGRSILSQAAAMQVTCDASVQRIVLDPKSVPLDIGRATRVIPPHIRRALAVRDGGCKFPYCDKPVAWCEAHHIKHWSNGGPTSLDNLVMLCSRHHHEVHSSGHEIEVDQLGKPKIIVKHEFSSSRE